MRGEGRDIFYNTFNKGRLYMILGEGGIDFMG